MLLLAENIYIYILFMPQMKTSYPKPTPAFTQSQQIDAEEEKKKNQDGTPKSRGHQLYLSKGQNYSKQTVWEVNFQMEEMFRPDPITVKHFHLEN